MVSQPAWSTGSETTVCIVAQRPVCTGSQNPRSGYQDMGIQGPQIWGPRTPDSLNNIREDREKGSQDPVQGPQIWGPRTPDSLNNIRGFGPLSRVRDPRKGSQNPQIPLIMYGEWASGKGPETPFLGSSRTPDSLRYIKRFGVPKPPKMGQNHPFWGYPENPLFGPFWDPRFGPFSQYPAG